MRGKLSRLDVYLDKNMRTALHRVREENVIGLRAGAVACAVRRAESNER
jgi:hypothetical protein